MRRTLFISAAVVLMLPSMRAAAKADSVEFVSGTVKAIPSNTVGALDTSNAAELRFRYGSSVYALPYQKISNAEIVEPTGHHLWKVPVPKLGKSARLLSITIHEGEDTGMLTFRTSASEAGRVAKRINDHGKVPTAALKPDVRQPATVKSRKDKESNAKTASAKPAPPAQETWWGDKYWKTTRNKDKWPSGQPADASGVPAGTK